MRHGMGSLTSRDRLRGLLAIDSIPVTLVSALAGDRPLTDVEKPILSRQKKIRGTLFYSDILYAVTHQYFEPNGAEELWSRILRHKMEMSRILKRNVQIIVATLDYLTNVQDEVLSPTLISESHIAEIVNLSMRDGLTQLFNHSSFYEILNLELRKYARHGTVLALILLDIDGFKEINDKYGHQEGDRVLGKIGDTIRNAVRESDICCRFGGDEFAVILPMTHAKGGAEIAEKIRGAVAGLGTADQPLTVSQGVASCSESVNKAFALVEKADKALYLSKTRGKNRVEISIPL